MLFVPDVRFHMFSKIRVSEWPPIGKIAANSAYDMLPYYAYLIFNLAFYHLGSWSRKFFLIVQFPDCCLLFTFLFNFNCSDAVDDKDITGEIDFLGYGKHTAHVRLFNVYLT